MKKGEPTPMSEAIQSWLRIMRLQSGVNQVDLVQACCDMLGPEMAKNCSNINFQSGKLFIQVNSDSLRSELKYAEEKMRDHLNNEIGKELVKQIVFK